MPGTERCASDTGLDNRAVTLTVRSGGRGARQMALPGLTLTQYLTDA